MKQVIYNPQGQIAGFIQNNIYRTSKDPEKHYFKMFQGYGISLSILKSLKEKEIKLIEISEIGTKKNYSFRTIDYLESSKEYSFNGDVQKFISLPAKNNESSLSTWGFGK